MLDGTLSRHLVEVETADVAAVDELMHVYVDGQWHRRTPDLRATACGVLFHGGYCSLRREELKGPLCPVCFTPFEIAKAVERADIERREHEELHSGEWVPGPNGAKHKKKERP